MTTLAWQVLTLNLEHPLPELPAPENAAGIHVQIWWKSLPLGQLWLPRELLPMAPLELARSTATAVGPAVANYLLPHGFRSPLPVMGDNPARDKPADFATLAAWQNPLSQLEQVLVQHPPASSVSVIVCTRNRPEELRKSLWSLTRLDPPANEILVVDNAPETDQTRKVCAEFSGVRYLAESHPGLSRARNAGIQQARSDIVAWTDDDTEADPGWVGAIREVFSDPDISAMTGLVLPGSLSTPAQVHFERIFGGFNRGFRSFTFDTRFFSEMQDRCVPAWLAGAGANMAFRRELFSSLGDFDERLGAGAAGCSEDSEYWYRLLAAGKSLRYEPRAVVRHFHRASDTDFRAQMRAYMRGHVAALLYQFEKHGHGGNLRRLFLSLPRYYWGMATGKLEGAERGTLTSEVLGGLQGIWYFLSHR